MAAISEAGHNGFLQRLETYVAPGQQKMVQADMELLQQIYKDYRSQLKRLRRLVEEYDHTQQNIRFKLRVQQQTTRREKS